MKAGYTYRQWLCSAAVLVIASLSPVGALAEDALAEGAPAEGYPMSELNPNAPAPNGWIAPTFDGDWRFRLELDAWAATVIQVTAEKDGNSASIDKGLGWVLSQLTY